MDFSERFAAGLERHRNRGASDEQAAAQLFTLQVLLDRAAFPDAAALRQAFQSFDTRLGLANVETDANGQGEDRTIIDWDEHEVQLIFIAGPMPAGLVGEIVEQSPFGPPLLELARGHRAHALVLYTGESPNLVDRYVALAAIAAALVPLGATVVLNEVARSAVPAAMLVYDKSDVTVSRLDVLKDLPLLVLYCGLNRFRVEGKPGFWSRTFGADRLGLPDLAGWTGDDVEGANYFDLFNDLLTYLRKTGATLSPGDTMKLGETAFLRLRPPAPDEPFPESDRVSLLVAEVIQA